MSGVYGRSIEKINEGAGVDLAFMGVLAAFLAIRAGVKEFKRKRADMKLQAKQELERKEKIEKFKKMKEAHDADPEWKKKRDQVGNELQKRLIKFLKDYVKKEKFDEKYKDSACSYLVACTIKPDDEISMFGVEISDCQNGWGDEIDPAWLRKHKDYKVKEDWSKDPVYNNDWYYELLDVGSKEAENIFKSIPGSEDMILDVDTGDGDEGLIYIDIY